MIKIADLPVIRAQLERDAAAAKDEAAAREDPPVQYARAPKASGVQSTAGRPPATQRTAR